ncbi:MAG: hypothetical protein PWQ57_3322 [Desulfovibrionales bacterium]|nr:hypothetical protein [Desulfovibrionales bacterium]
MPRHYVAEPTPERFHLSDARIRGLMGPYGSGKSVSCVQEGLLRSAQQIPGLDGVRHSRGAIIRNSYPELKSTTIKTWMDWAADCTSITYGSPITGRVRFKRQDDDSLVDAEIFFIALDKPKDIKKLLSLELTWAWINEAREVPKQVVDALGGRIGRYPSKADGGFNWTGFWMDTNPPDTDHWWYRTFEEERPVGYEIFKQPPALQEEEISNSWQPNPAAENVQNQVLGYDYWLNQVPGKTEEWIRVYLCGEYGMVQEGKVVYPEYLDSSHCADGLKPMTAVPLVIGLDFGLTPASVIGQVTPRGQLFILDEMTSHDMGIRQFLRDALLPHLAQDYAGVRVVCMGDPAGAQRAQTDARSCFDEVRAAGLEINAAPTNAFIPRREAVAGFLTRMVDGKPAFQLSPECKMLRRGFQGGYHFERVQVSGERYKDQPAKNQFSHPHDALQYLALRAQVGTTAAAQPKGGHRPVKRVRWP